MKKTLISALLAVGVMLPTAAFAAVVPEDFGFQINGLSSDTVAPGEAFTVTSNFDVNSGNEVEFIRTRLINSNGDVVHNQCDAVGRISDVDDRISTQTVTTVNDLAEGKYKVERAFFGKDGEDSSNGCELANLKATKTYSDRLFVKNEQNNDGGSNNNSGNPSNTTGDTNSSGSVTWNGIAVPGWFAAFMLNFNKPATTTTPVVKNECTVLQTKTVGTQYGVYNDANISLQGLLLSDNPTSIPALKAGSTVPMGFYGPQTQNAVFGYKAKYGCQ